MSNDFTVAAARVFATGAHAAVVAIRRDTGEDYIVHPLDVVCALQEFGVDYDADMLATCWLHDVVEDTQVTIQQIEDVFGFTVHFVHETHPRHTIFVSLAPHCFRLRLNTRNRVKHRNRTIENAQRPLNFNCEVNVARRVNNVDPLIVPKTGRRS